MEERRPLRIELAGVEGHGWFAVVPTASVRRAMIAAGEWKRNGGRDGEYQFKQLVPLLVERNAKVKYKRATAGR